MVRFNLFWDVKVAGVASICKFSCIAQQSCSRDFGSRKVWRKRRKVLIMQYRNQQLKVFEEWKQNRLVKSCTLEPGGLFTTKDLEEGAQTLDTAIAEMSACSLNYWLSKFAQSKQFFRGGLSILFVVLNYLRTEAPPFWCKLKCCIEPIANVPDTEGKLYI